MGVKEVSTTTTNIKNTHTHCKHCIAIQIYYPFQIAWPGAKVCNPEIKMYKNKRKYKN